MENVLKDLGWGDGFKIPVANAENKALEVEVIKTYELNYTLFKKKNFSHLFGIIRL